MKAYQDMINEVLATGTRKENRTGVDTISTFGHYYELCWDPNIYPEAPGPKDHRHCIDKPSYTMMPPTWDSADLHDYQVAPGLPVPLLTTKDVSWKNIVVEMLWFLSGHTDIEILQRHKCKFWDPWADDKGKVPSAYGNFWRNFPTHDGPLQISDNGVTVDFPDGSPAFNDQIAWVLDQLRKNPMSRRLIVSAWAPGNAQTSKLPPCHMVFAFNVQNVEEPLTERLERARKENPDALPEQIRNTSHNTDWYKDTADGRKLLDQNLRTAGFEPKIEQRLCLHLTQRSCDLALGVPYNMASYGLLLLLFSHLTGIKPGIFAHTLLDLHIYTKKPDGSMAEYDHIPGLKEQLNRYPRPLPKLVIDPSIKELSDIEALMSPEVSTEDILAKFKLDLYQPYPAIKFKVAV